MKKLSKILIIFGITVSLINSKIFAADRNLPGITIISREERGADESIRLTSYPKWQSILASRAANQKALEKLRETDYSAYLKKVAESDKANEKKDVANAYLAKNYYNDIYTDRSNNLFDGQEIWRKESHRDKKTKILIHHTASDNTTIKSQQDAIEYLQYVYKYHTLNNARGDIGYNFIIDPFGNIYEGRAGGEGTIGAHAKRNNTPSVGIVLIGNFENVEPTKEAVDSLIKLTAALVEKYNINPNGQTNYYKDSTTSPYIQVNKNYTIAGHKDAGTTACPGKYLYDILPYIRTSVNNIINGKSRESSESIGLKSHLQNNTTKTSSKTSNTKKTKSQKLTYEYFESLQSIISPAVNKMKNDYMTKSKITAATNYSDKILGKISLSQAKSLLKQDISVLLYELTQDYKNYKISCEGGCTFSFDGNKIQSENGEISIGISNTLALSIGNETYTTQKINITSSNDIITIENYTRKSYAGIPRNAFHGTLIFQKDYIKDKKGNQSYKNVVINELPFSDYMKGIVETNDTETQTKNNVMALIAKSYALFYMNESNQHPNIPNQATYNAVDDPDIFQKYVGAGLEKTLTKWYKALTNTEDKIILYNNIVPILPYFSCSVGFTYSAYEKRGREDTPYLESRFDIGVCSDKKFSGHGVGLSGLGAETRAKMFGRSYLDILKYYYPGIKIVDL